jgi:hypothetical protein
MNRTPLLSAIFLTFSFSLSTAAGLEYVDVNSTLSSIFSSTTDDNEGTTVFRSLNIPTGGKAESMGTAYTGLSDDTGFFEYNPAASSVMENTEVAVFHNAWIADSAMETIAATLRNGNMGMGVQLKCFYVPFTEYNLYGSRTAGSYYSETAATANISYNFLAGYTFRGLAAGMNFRTAWRNMPDYTDNDTDEIITGSGLAQSALGIMTDIGVMIRINAAKFYTDREPNLRIGLSANNIGIAITGFGSAQGITTDDPLPTKISAGIAYRPTAPVTITADFRQPVNLQDISTSGSWSAGTGFQIQTTAFFAVLGGFLIQGGNPRISMGSEFDVKGVKMDVNYTFDLTSSLNPVNHISLAAKLNLGDRGRAELGKKRDNYYAAGIAAYADGDLDTAILFWKEALKIDKRYDPALTGIKTAEKTKALYRHIVDIQSLD